MSDHAASPAHGLTHRSFTDRRLTPACTCGWWSPGGSHAEFERHIRSTSENPRRDAESECLELAARYDAETQVSVEVPS